MKLLTELLASGLLAINRHITHGFDLDPHVLPLDDANDVRAPESAEPIKVFLRIDKRA
jgi:hypothetical protein